MGGATFHEVVVEVEFAVVSFFVLAFPLGKLVLVLQPTFVVAEQKRFHALDPRVVNRFTDGFPHELNTDQPLAAIAELPPSNLP